MPLTVNSRLSRKYTIRIFLSTGTKQPAIFTVSHRTKFWFERSATTHLSHFSSRDSFDLEVLFMHYTVLLNVLRDKRTEGRASMSLTIVATYFK